MYGRDEIYLNISLKQGFVKGEVFCFREGFKKNKKKLIEFSIKGWVGESGRGQILLKKTKKKTCL